MLRFFLAFFILTLYINAQALSFSQKEKVYTIALFCAKKTQSIRGLLKEIPFQLRHKIHLHDIKNHQLVVCYSQEKSYKTIQKELQKVKKAGYKGAYIIRTSRYYVSKNLQNQDLDKKAPKLSKYMISKMIAKANTAYKRGNGNEAMTYYEMLLAAGVKSNKIKNNLCYLYGKNGAWEQAKDIIDKQKYASKLIYAYANGAVMTLQKNYYNDLTDYIMFDKSGHLMLLTGYYFEQKGNKQKALRFYKMAYEKNKNDIYNIYAYARYLDIMGRYQEANQLYRIVYENTDEANALHKAIKNRLYR